MRSLISMTTRDEFKELMVAIKQSYPTFTIIDRKEMDAWYAKLSPISFESLKETLSQFVLQSEAPPKVVDFITRAKTGAIPSVRETTYIIYSPYRPASHDVIVQCQAKMRELLRLEV
jgi:hypothetical protein